METKVINKNQYQELMNKFNEFKGKIIHVTINKGRQKVINAPSKVKGVYGRFVCVTSKINNYEENFTISYTDILTKVIEIKEIIL